MRVIEEKTYLLELNDAEIKQVYDWLFEVLKTTPNPPTIAEKLKSALFPSRFGV